jgi:hypothetical protein
MSGATEAPRTPAMAMVRSTAYTRVTTSAVLRRWCNQHGVKGDRTNWTHLSMDALLTGKLNIPPALHDSLYTTLEEVLSVGDDFYLLERRMPVFRMHWDIDKCAVTLADMRRATAVIVRTLRRLYSADVPEDTFTCVIAQRQRDTDAPQRAALDGEEEEDVVVPSLPPNELGYHITCALRVTTPVAMQICFTVIQELEVQMSALGHEWAKIIDTSIFANPAGSLRMAFASKTANNPNADSAEDRKLRVPVVYRPAGVVRGNGTLDRYQTARMAESAVRGLRALSIMCSGDAHDGFMAELAAPAPSRAHTKQLATIQRRARQSTADGDVFAPPASEPNCLQSNDQMAVLARALSGLNPCWKGIRVRRVVKGDSGWRVDVSSHYCLNKDGLHGSNHIFFWVDPSARLVKQRCYATTTPRAKAPRCADFASNVYSLPPDVTALLLPPDQQAQLCSREAEPAGRSLTLLYLFCERAAEAAEVVAVELPPVHTGPRVEGQLRLPPDLNAEQQAAYEAALRGRSMFFTGAAGTGKNYLLRAVVQGLVERHSPTAREQRHALPRSRVLVMSATSDGASFVGGTTVHACMGFGPVANDADPRDIASTVFKNNKVVGQRLRYARVLIIDDINRLPAAVFEAASLLCSLVTNEHHSPFGNKQLIVCGDFFQLPPPRATNGPTYAFQTPAWAKVGFSNTVLAQRMRQSEDPELADALDRFRWGAHIAADTRLLRKPRAVSVPTSICCNANQMDVEDRNRRELENVSDAFEYESNARLWSGGRAKDSSSAQSLMRAMQAHGEAPMQLTLRLGVAVMLTINLDVRAQLVNGARGIVVGFSPERKLPVVEFVCGTTVLIEPHVWTQTVDNTCVAHLRQLPLVLGWAVTVQQAQGRSIDAVHIRFAGCSHARAYVAVSRPRALHQLHLEDDLPRQSPCPMVIEFYRALGCAPPAPDQPPPKRPRVSSQ